MSEFYSITFRGQSRYNDLELVQKLIIGDWTLEFNGMMHYLPKAPDDDTCDTYNKDFVEEACTLAKLLSIAQSQYLSRELISFDAILNDFQWPLSFIFGADRLVDVSFTYLDFTFSKKYKLADLNLVLLNYSNFLAITTVISTASRSNGEILWTSRSIKRKTHFPLTPSVHSYSPARLSTRR